MKLKILGYQHLPAVSYFLSQFIEDNNPAH
jgi:hypothetical protein